MLKSFLMALAGVWLIGVPVLGGDAAGTYVAQTPQGPMSMELGSDRDGLVGAIHYQGRDYPVIAAQRGNAIQGSFRGQVGRVYGLVGSIDASGSMTVAMLGGVYQFQRQAAAAPPPAPAAPAAPAPVPANPLGANPVPTTAPAAAAAAPAPTTAPAAPDAQALGLQTRQGRSLQCDVPPGWSFSDTNNGVDSMSPDGITWMSRTFLRGRGLLTPDLLLKRDSNFWPRLGITDAKLVSEKAVNAQSKLYELDYNFRGRPAHSMVQATVTYGPGGAYLANLVSLQSARDAFGQNLPVLKAMAMSVRVIDANQFADTGKFKAEGEKRNQIAADTARDIGQTYIKGEQARGKIRDESNKGADDTLRSVTRFKDSDGKEYVGPLQATRAFKHSDGTVTYTSDITAPVPSDAVEIPPYDYTGKN